MTFFDVTIQPRQLTHTEAHARFQHLFLETEANDIKVASIVRRGLSKAAVRHKEPTQDVEIQVERERERGIHWATSS